MNFLVHLYLSGNDPEILVGNFIGDFVKGRVNEQFPHPLKDGIRLHRMIDSFADHHPLFLKSRHRLSADYGLYRGVMVDLFYDHFLAKDWEDWSLEPLHRWLRSAREIIDTHQALLPEPLHRLVPIIFDELIPSYREVEGIREALKRMSRRVRQPNPLDGGEKELISCYGDLHHDFRLFFPDMRDFVADMLSQDLPVPLCNH